MELQPLKEDEARLLARELVGEAAKDLDAYVARSDGNPLFLEQLTRGPMDRASELPDTLQGLVLARMDRLPAHDRAALRTASVLGQQFSLESLRFLMGDGSYDCAQLLEHQLVRPEGSGYLFAHALIQEGVYASLLQDRRRALHARAAEWFKDRDLPLHASHLDREGSASAPGAYLAAAREQAADARLEYALQLVARGLELASEQESFELCLLQGEFLRNLASVPESIAAYRRATGVAQGQAELCRALIGVAEGLRLRDKHSDLLATLTEAAAAAEAQQLKPELARIGQLRGNVHFVRGEVDECLRVNTASLSVAREVGSPELEAQALGGLGEAEFARGRMISAFHYYDRCIALGREHGFARVVAANLSMRGQTLAYMNNLAAAMSDCRAGVELAAKIRQPRAEMIAGIVATYILDLTDPIEGEAWARGSLAIARRLGAQVFEAINLEYLGRFAAQRGRHAEAVELVQQALDILRRSDSGIRFLACRTLGALALVTPDAARQATALAEGEALLHCGVPAFNHLWFDRDAIEISLRTAQWNSVEKYARMLDEFTQAEPLPWSGFFVARGRALAAFGLGRRDPDLMQELGRLRDEARRIGLNHALRALEGAFASG
jgi:tetratricopeptide (TPR) repeat protein